MAFTLAAMSTYVGFAAIVSTWSDTSTLEASSGSTLTSANWNKLV